MSKAISSVLGAVCRLGAFGVVAALLIAPASCGRSAEGTAGGRDGGGTGGSACACDDTTPRCAERVTSICGETGHCPPTLEDLLDYSRWPQVGAMEFWYSTCDDGTRYFTTSDPFGESRYFRAFDVDGKLYFAGKALEVTCGEWSIFNAGATCRTCDIVREGGLEPVGSGSGGEGGAAASPVGRPYCLVDQSGFLVMPPGG